MSSLVIIASLIAFIILITIKKTLIFIERIRSQRSRYNIGSVSARVSVISTYLKYVIIS